MAVLEVSGKVNLPFPYNPDDWQFEMDNATLDLGLGPAKYQGTVLADVLGRWEPASGAEEVVFRTRDGQEVSAALADVLADRSLRIWTVSSPEGMRLALAREDGTVLAHDVVACDVR